MKALIILLLILSFLACKKKPNPPAQSTVPAVSVIKIKYNVTFIINKDPNNFQDTLVIKINDTLKIQQYGPQIVNNYIKCMSGDNLYIHYRPGSINENGQIKTAYNRLDIFFSDTLGHILYSVNYNACRCTGTNNYTLK